jgi:excisionase family DNA binding protein
VRGADTLDTMDRLQKAFFSPSEIATYTGFSTYTIQAFCREGRLRHVKKGRLIFIKKQWADDFMAADERGPS